jgi:Family of unknown function (DUF5691)
MIENILATAIVGTGQANGQDITTGTPIDALTTQLGTGEIERKLLLMAGSLAVYQQAGQLPEQAPEPPQPDAPESIPACSAKVGHLLQGLLQGEQRELLPEALDRLQQAGQRLPYELLPLALGYGAQSKEIRPALFAVLGERGRWLSQFEKTWAWASQFLASETLPDDAETLWLEGTIAQRSQLLTRIRLVEPAKAREWLADVWKQEKADVRTELLATLQTGLSSADEPFLEKALDDRSEAVRETSSALLAYIPTSALAQRMLARADALLTYTNGTWSIMLPPKIDVSWQRDGIKTLPSHKTDPQTWYARQVLAVIPPTHWEERFSIAPVDTIADLIAKKDKKHTATSKGALLDAERESAIGELLLVCWLYAATRFESPRWVEPLWAWWCKHPDTYPIHDISSASVYQALGKRLPQRVAEHYVQLHYIQEQSEQWALVVEALPTPWSSDFGDACLDELRSYIFGLDDKSYPGGSWQTAFTRIALALPPTCFDAALEPWQFPEPTTWQIQQWKNQLKTFMTLVRKRQQIIEEI